MAVHSPEKEILSQFIPSAHVDAYYEGRSEDFLQPLMDLGYFPRRLYDPEEVERVLHPGLLTGPAFYLLSNYIHRGLQAFRQDAVEQGLLRPSEIGLHLDGEENPHAHPGSLEAELLDRLVAFDGEMALAGIPEIGEQSVRSRRLLYQLDVYGLYDGSPDAEFSNAHLQILRDLRQMLQVAEISLLPALLSDAEAFSTAVFAIRNRPEMADLIAYFELPYAEWGGVGNARRKFRRMVEDTVGDTGLDLLGRLVNLRKKRDERIRDDAAVTARLQAPPNHLLIRLIQVRLWTRGFYPGKLDSEFGPMSLQSLKEFAEHIDINLDRFLLQIGTNRQAQPLWCINAWGLFQQMRGDSSEVSADDGLELLSHEVGEMDESEQVAFQGELRDSVRKNIVAVKKHMTRGRRIYRGLRELWASLKRGGRKIIEVIRHGIRKALEFGRRIVGAIYRKIREGMRVLAKGFKFLFSDRRFLNFRGNHVIIASDFDADFDLVQFASPDVTPEELAQHDAHLRSITRDLNFSMKLTGKVLGWVLRISTGSVTWPMLALRVAREFRDLLLNRWARRPQTT